MTASFRGDSARSGFTLIELLLTVGILGILAAMVILALDPQKQIEDAYDAQRRIDLNTIFNAIYQFQIKKDRLPRRGSNDAILVGEANKREICVLVDHFDCAGKAYLAELIEYEYLTAIPQDPRNTDPAGSGYEIWRNEEGRICVQAPLSRNPDKLRSCR